MPVWNANTATVMAAPNSASVMMRTRRSVRSEAQPIGYWQISPPSQIAATKADTSRTFIPITDPQTGDIPCSAANTPPIRKMPTQPRGDARNSLRMLIGAIVSNLGAGVVASSIGVNATDTRTDGMTNSTQPPGSPKFIRNCALTSPSICTIM